MSRILLLTNSSDASAAVLPALGLLGHQVRVLPAEAAALLDAPAGDLLLVDGRRDLPGARSLCRVLRATGSDLPVLLIITEGGLAAVAPDWGVDDILLESAGPGEVEARFRLAIGRMAENEQETEPEIRHGELLIDEGSYTATVRGRVLDLTYKEFELLKYLSQHPGRVFTRQQLLQEVWGYNSGVTTHTLETHVYRLRQKIERDPSNAEILVTESGGYKLIP